MTNFVIGAQMYSVRDRCTNYEDMLACMKELKAGGYNVCQLSGQSRDLTPDQLHALCEESGLKCGATHVSFEQMEEDLDKVIAMHKTLGCVYPGIGGLPAKYRDSAEGFAEFARRAGVIAEKLLDHGMHFIYHAHHCEFKRLENGRFGYDVMLENSPAALQYELDCFWAQVGGQNVTDRIRSLKGRMDVIHFKDMDVGSWDGFHMCPIGDGSMDYLSIMAASDEIGVKYAFVEQDNAPESECGSAACLLRSLEYLKANGGRF